MHWTPAFSCAFGLLRVPNRLAFSFRLAHDNSNLITNATNFPQYSVCLNKLSAIDLDNTCDELLAIFDELAVGLEELGDIEELETLCEVDEFEHALETFADDDVTADFLSEFSSANDEREVRLSKFPLPSHSLLNFSNDKFSKRFCFRTL